MIIALYQYGMEFGPANNIKLGYKSALLIKKNDRIYRQRISGNQLDTKDFYSVEDFKDGSSSTRTNFRLEFIYD